MIEQKSASKNREDGRRQFLAYMRPEIVLRLKQEALLRNTHMYLLLEDIIEAYFEGLQKD